MKWFLLYVYPTIFYAKAEESTTILNQQKDTKNAEISRRIYSANDAKEGQFPYAVSIRINNAHVCGGAILNPRWVVTAGHWVDITVSSPDELEIFAGTIYLSSRGQYNYGADIVVYPEQNVDLALVKTFKRFAFSSLVKTIELHDPYLKGNDDVMLAGWGDPDNTTTKSNTLKYIQTKTLAPADCDDAKKDIYVCTSNSPGHGACVGDGGSPLVMGGKLVGINSYYVSSSAKSCGTGNPDGFVRISYVKTWIDSIIIDQYCGSLAYCQSSTASQSPNYKTLHQYRPFHKVAGSRKG